MDDLNRKLAEWVGFIYDESLRTSIYKPSTKWITPDGHIMDGIPDFAHSLDACFKWLVPKLREGRGRIRIGFDYFDTGGGEVVIEEYVKLITGWYWTYLSHYQPARGFDPALALCKAIEKLIDEAPAQFATEEGE